MTDGEDDKKQVNIYEWTTGMEPDVEHQDKIASGGYGQVHRMRNKITGQVFARKLVERQGGWTQKVLENEEEAIKTFLAKKPHENLVAVLKYGWLSNTSFYHIDMELCDGNLEDYILCKAPERFHVESNPRLLGQSCEDIVIIMVWDIMEQISNGVAFIHSCKKIHRDLKPQNVLFYRNADGSGTWKVGDFGFTTDGSSNHYAFSPNGRGTTCYRAPEMVVWKDERTPPQINNKVDIFALGCILFELVTPQGLKAFPNDYCLIEYNLTRTRPEVTWGEEIDQRWQIILTALFEEMLSLDSPRRPSAARLRNIFARHRAVSLGDRCFAKKEFQTALEAFCVAAEIGIDDDTVVANNLRDLHRELKQFENAEDACVIAMTDLSDPSALVRQARTLRANGRHEQALDAYLQYFYRNPNNEGLYTEIGDAYMSVEDYDNAMSMYFEAIKYEPNAYLYGQLSKAFLGKRDFDSAISVCKTGIEKYGLSHHLWDCYLEATKAKKARPKRSPKSYRLLTLFANHFLRTFSPRTSLIPLRLTSRANQTEEKGVENHVVV